jgi:hypothetical protein
MIEYVRLFSGRHHLKISTVPVFPVCARDITGKRMVLGEERSASDVVCQGRRKT